MIKYVKGTYFIQNQAWLSHLYKHWLIDGEKWNDESDVDALDEEYDCAIINKRPIPASDEPLTGFSSQGGSDMVTNGILMWGKPFILTDQTTGEKVLLIVTRCTIGADIFKIVERKTAKL